MKGLIVKRERGASEPLYVGYELQGYHCSMLAACNLLGISLNSIFTVGHILQVQNGFVLWDQPIGPTIRVCIPDYDVIARVLDDNERSP